MKSSTGEGVHWLRLISYIVCAAFMLIVWWMQLYKPAGEFLFTNAGAISVAFGLLLVLLNLFYVGLFGPNQSKQKDGMSPPHDWWQYGDSLFSAFRHATMLYVSIVVLHLALNRPEVLGIGVGTPQAIVGVAIASPAYFSLTHFWGRAREVFARNTEIVPVQEAPPGTP